MPHPRWLCVLLLISVQILPAHPDHGPGEPMAAAANAWLSSLDEAQRARAVYPLDDAERENWHFIPKARNGLPLKAMQPAQRQLARALLAAGLSERGLLTTDAIMALEEVLFAMEGAGHRDPGLYYFTLFGRPDPHATWGWRLEGHHLSVNFLLIDGTRVSATPLFFGANPAEVRIAHPQQGRRALAAEEDLGRAFMRSLSPDQQRTALIATRAPSDVITGSDRVAGLGTPTGLPYTDMTADQQDKLRELVSVYAGRLRPDVATGELQKIADQGWNTLYFAWAGGLEPGQGHYYRIHSRGFAIEYDNTQNNANHIHTTWRNFAGDFGRDLLREHYQDAHAGGSPHP